MARLKLRELLMPEVRAGGWCCDDALVLRAVQPPRHAGTYSRLLLPCSHPLPQVVSLVDAEGGGAKAQRVNKVKSWAVNPRLFPCDLSPEAQALVRDAVAAAVAAWGARQVEELEAEERLAFACEKAPTQDPVIEKVRVWGCDVVCVCLWSHADVPAAPAAAGSGPAAGVWPRPYLLTRASLLPRPHLPRRSALLSSRWRPSTRL